MKNETHIREHAPYAKPVIFWWVVIAGLIGATSFAAIALRPAWLGFERKAFVASHQYIENKRAAIAAKLAQCKTLPEGTQRQALRQQIEADAALIPTDTRPFTGGC